MTNQEGNISENRTLENSSGLATMSGKKVAIVGLGPVGLILAVHLQEAGLNVALCDIDRIKLNLIRKEGIRLEGKMKKKANFDLIFHDIQDLEALGPELILFSLKTYQLPGLLEEVQFLSRTDAGLVSAQNGIDVENMISEAYGESRTLRMVINFAGILTAPNVCKVTFFNPPNYIASLDDGRQQQVREFADLLNKVDLTTIALDSYGIIPRIWEKTILNSSLSALCGIGKLTIREAMEMPDTLEVIEQIIGEAVEVAATEKIRFEDDFIRKCLRYLKNAGDHFPSLAVDLLNNRPTEIDFLNGKIVEYGKKHYVRTSTNLVFTNMVKALTQKNLNSQLPGWQKTLNKKGVSGLNMLSSKSTPAPKAQGNCFLGIDLGSAYTKFALVDETGSPVFQATLRTHNSNRTAIGHVMEAVFDQFPVVKSCATGYGRKHFQGVDIVKTEINCAATGINHFFQGEKSIIDIGGEDIKVIICSENGEVENFYLNDKCAAGTGSFISEVAERAGIDVREMSILASRSEFKQELNSFCTVFAKTEIMGWLFEGVPVEDLARGVYLSIGNRVGKLRLDLTRPLYMIGGVVAHHPFLKDLLEEKFGKEIRVPRHPQHIVATGAAIMAQKAWARDHQHPQTLTFNSYQNEGIS